jgi:hypothetical protein
MPKIKKKMKSDFCVSVHILICKFECQLMYAILAIGEFSKISNAPVVCQLGGEDWTLQIVLKVKIYIYMRVTIESSRNK